MQLSSPQTISQKEYASILDSGEAGPMKHGYPAVIIHPDDTITKLWAKKTGLLSSSRWKPYSKRFIQNAEQLKKHGVRVPNITAHMKIGDSHVHLVQYQSLPGQSIRDLLEHHPEQVDIPTLARYFFDLHEKGIIFRANHFGNVVQMPDLQYGLIDFTDVTFLMHPAPLVRRAANIATPLRYRDDVELLKKAGLPELPETYLSILREQSSPIDEKAFFDTIQKRTGRKP